MVPHMDDETSDPADVEEPHSATTHDVALAGEQPTDSPSPLARRHVVPDNIDNIRKANSCIGH